MDRRTNQYGVINIIKDEDFDKKEIKNDYLATRNNILQFWYPRNVVSIFLRRVELIKRSEYPPIKDYLRALEESLQGYSISGDLIANDPQRTLHEYFMRSLGKNTKMELCKQNPNDMKAVIKYQTLIEENILLLSKEKSNNNPTRNVNDNKKKI